MIAYFFLLLYIYVNGFSLIYSPKDDLLVTMQDELRHLAEPLPAETNTLISKFSTDHSYDIGSTTSEGLDPFLTTWKLGEDITALFQQAAFATTEQFESFTFNAAPSYVFFEEYLGAAKNVNGTIALAYMRASASATPITQTNTVSVRNCHTCWLVMKCCSSASVKVPRGFIASEIEIMRSSLRATVYQRFVHDFPTKTFKSYRSALLLPEDF